MINFLFFFLNPKNFHIIKKNHLKLPVSPPEEVLAIKSGDVIEKDQIEIIKVKENLIFNNLKLILKLFNCISKFLKTKQFRSLLNKPSH